MSVAAPPDCGATSSSVAWAQTPADQLRLRVWQAISPGVLGMDTAAHQRRIRQGLVAAEPIAVEILEVLETRAAPESDLDFSLLASVGAMAAFGCLATDYVYSRAATAERWKPDVARFIGVFVVASALFDHLCDRQPEQLAMLEDTVTPELLLAAFAGQASGDPLPDAPAPVPLAYLGALGAEAARLWSHLSGDTRGNQTGPVHAALWERLAAAYRAQLASVPAGATGRPATRDVGVIWSAPFATALFVAAATSDAAPGLQLHVLLPEAERLGRLLSLVDDLADIEDDWKWGSANQYLDRAVCDRRRRAGDPAPWPTLLSDAVLEPYLGDIVALLDSLPDEERASLVAWLGYWMGT